jgi:hypothetical protein
VAGGKSYCFQKADYPFRSCTWPGQRSPRVTSSAAWTAANIELTRSMAWVTGADAEAIDLQPFSHLQSTVLVIWRPVDQYYWIIWPCI